MTTETDTRRRKYCKGKCGDCGHFRNVTQITFWVNGHQMLVCSECIKPYRGRILKIAESSDA